MFRRAMDRQNGLGRDSWNNRLKLRRLNWSMFDTRSRVMAFCNCCNEDFKTNDALLTADIFTRYGHEDFIYDLL